MSRPNRTSNEFRAHLTVKLSNILVTHSYGTAKFGSRAKTGWTFEPGRRRRRRRDDRSVCSGYAGARPRSRCARSPPLGDGPNAIWTSFEKLPCTHFRHSHEAFRLSERVYLLRACMIYTYTCTYYNVLKKYIHVYLYKMYLRAGFFFSSVSCFIHVNDFCTNGIEHFFFRARTGFFFFLIF